MEVKGLGFAFGNGHRVLKSIDLKVDSGEAVFIYGLNGSGKSTLALALSGIIEKVYDGELS